MDDDKDLLEKARALSEDQLRELFKHKALGHYDEARDRAARTFGIHTWLPPHTAPEDLQVGEGIYDAGGTAEEWRPRVTLLNKMRPGRWIAENRAPLKRRTPGTWAIMRVDPLWFVEAPNPLLERQIHPLRNLIPGQDLHVQWLEDFETDFMSGNLSIHGAVFRAPVKRPGEPFYRLQCLTNPHCPAGRQALLESYRTRADSFRPEVPDTGGPKRFGLPKTDAMRLAARRDQQLKRRTTASIWGVAREDLDYLMKEWGFPNQTEAVRAALWYLAKHTREDKVESLPAAR